MKFKNPFTRQGKSWRFEVKVANWLNQSANKTYLIIGITILLIVFNFLFFLL